MSERPAEPHPHTLLARGFEEAVRRSSLCQERCVSFSVTLILDLEHPLIARLCGCALAWFREEYPAHDSNLGFEKALHSDGYSDVPPCPFCGGTSFHLDGLEDNEGVTFSVLCDRCHASGPIITEDEGRAITAWSLRTSTPRDWLGASFRGYCYEHPLPPDRSGVLRACPFCGHSVFHLDGNVEDEPEGAVSCDTCEAAGPRCGDRDETIGSWNKRSNSPVDESHE